jgi:hypothetical protein
MYVLLAVVLTSLIALFYFMLYSYVIQCFVKNITEKLYKFCIPDLQFVILIHFQCFVNNSSPKLVKNYLGV